MWSQQFRGNTMTEAMAPSLTPPGKAPKAPRAKKEKVAKDPNAPVKPRAPRTNYGYHELATISILTTEKAGKLRGHRLAWYQSIQPFAGKTVKDWEEDRKGEKDPPRGWLRFMVQEGLVGLESPPAVAQAA
jgi:hypothetical protein